MLGGDDVGGYAAATIVIRAPDDDDQEGFPVRGAIVHRLGTGTLPAVPAQRVFRRHRYHRDQGCGAACLRGCAEAPPPRAQRAERTGACERARWNGRDRLCRSVLSGARPLSGKESVMQDLSYIEKPDRLAVRIRAHKEFANLDIDEWIAAFLSRCRRRAIFDLGCGNGNHLQLYLDCVGSDGRVAGLDREATLIDQAKRRFVNAYNLDLRVGSMDVPLPFAASTFDTAFSNFA